MMIDLILYIRKVKERKKKFESVLLWMVKSKEIDSGRKKEMGKEENSEKEKEDW